MPPDLKLASSYVPALVCVSKGLVVGTLTYYMFPMGGCGLIGLLLLLDRIHLNLTSIVDVNSIVVFVTVLTAVTRDRAKGGVEPPAGAMLTGVWACVSILCSIGQPVSFRVEVLVLSATAALTSVTQMAPEIVWLLLVRVVCMLIPVLLMVYTTDSCGFDVVLGLLRTAPVMFAPLIPALLASVVLSVVVVWRWRKTQLFLTETNSDVVISEQTLLREALARQKSLQQHIC